MDTETPSANPPVKRFPRTRLRGSQGKIHQTLKLVEVRDLFILNFSVANLHPHPSTWFWSPGSASGIRILNADSRCGCGFKLSSEKLVPRKDHQYYVIKN
jgi:hypothetical protein